MARFNTLDINGTAFSIYATLLVVIANAQELRLVLQVIVQHQEIGIEVDDPIGHQLLGCVVEKRPVFYAAASPQVA